MEDPRSGINVACREITDVWGEMYVGPCENDEEYLPEPLVLVPWENGDPITIEDLSVMFTNSSTGRK